jgi:hypothetical protein
VEISYWLFVKSYWGEKMRSAVIGKEEEVAFLRGRDGEGKS